MYILIGIFSKHKATVLKSKLLKRMKNISN